MVVIVGCKNFSVVPTFSCLGFLLQILIITDTPKTFRQLFVVLHLRWLPFYFQFAAHVTALLLLSNIAPLLEIMEFDGMLISLCWLILIWCLQFPANNQCFVTCIHSHHIITAKELTNQVDHGTPYYPYTC